MGPNCLRTRDIENNITASSYPIDKELSISILFFLKSLYNLQLQKLDYANFNDFSSLFF